jgi:hypothetical protein
MDAHQKNQPAPPFRFLDEEQFRALTAKEKMAYLTAATGELQRLADEDARSAGSRTGGSRPE